MIALNLLKGKSLGILGLGKTGISVLNAGLPFAQKILCYDDKESVRDSFARQDLLLSYEDSEWSALNYIVVSPGIPKSHPIFSHKSTRPSAKRIYGQEFVGNGFLKTGGVLGYIEDFQGSFNAEIISRNSFCRRSIISDIDLLYMHHPEKYYIGVTGTNGKSTTTALIAHILSVNGRNFIAGGNIGTPVLDLSEDRSSGYVLELSSFQLDLLKHFKANIGIVLNLSVDHTDRYKSMEDYLNSKISLIHRSKHAIVGLDDPYTTGAYGELKHKHITAISSTKVLNQGIYVNNDIIHIVLQGSVNAYKLPYNKFLQGAHNKQNIAAAFAACLEVGLVANEILSGIESFVGLPHRMQFVHESGGIHFYNDSKATNPEAASKSIATLRNIYLLAGGIAKTQDMSPIMPYIDHINTVYLYGLDKHILQEAFKRYAKTCIFDTLEEAMSVAIHDALKDTNHQKNILLAPLCSSLDQFKNFEERGDLFTTLSQDFCSLQ